MKAGILPRIAVIDDEQRLREALGNALARKGFAVRTATDDMLAQALLESRQPEAIVLEATAPATDGFSVLAVVRNFSRVPILLVMLSEVDRAFHYEKLAMRLRDALRVCNVTRGTRGHVHLLHSNKDRRPTGAAAHSYRLGHRLCDPAEGALIENLPRGKSKKATAPRFAGLG